MCTRRNIVCVKLHYVIEHECSFGDGLIWVKFFKNQFTLCLHFYGHPVIKTCYKIYHKSVGQRSRMNLHFFIFLPFSRLFGRFVRIFSVNLKLELSANKVQLLHLVVFKNRDIVFRPNFCSIFLLSLC